MVGGRVLVSSLFAGAELWWCGGGEDSCLAPLRRLFVWLTLLGVAIFA